jgi:hypothetical protein
MVGTVRTVNLLIMEFNYEFLCKIWGLQDSDYEEYPIPQHKNPVCTSQETHYVSATEPSRLMLRKFWGFHSGDYEECRLLGYKNPARTSQETHYISTTEPSQLLLCKIWDFHGGDYEKCHLLRCGTVWCFRRMYHLHHQGGKNQHARNISSN